MNEELPEGWCEAVFGDLITELRNGISTRPALQPPGVPILRISAARPGSVALDDIRYLPKGDGLQATFGLRDNDLLFTRYNGSVELLGVCGMVRGLGARSLVYPDKLMRVRLRDALLPEFVEIFFQSRSARQAIEAIAKSSAGQQGISGSDLKAQRVAVPPLAEQRRIVAKVDELLGEVNRAKARLVKVHAILKRFRQSVLAAACSGELTREWRSQRELPDMTQTIVRLMQTAAAKVRRGVPDAVDRPEALERYEHPERWAEVSVAQALRCGLLIDVKDGNHGANHPKVAEFGRNGLAFITAAQVGWFSIDYDGAYKIAGAPLKKLRVGFAQPGDAILTHKGSVGRAALCDRACVLTPQTTYYRPSPALVDGEYLTYWFASLWFYGQLAAVMSQTTRDFVPISEQYRLFLVLPPLEEQREIARRVRGLLALASAVEAKVNASVGRCDRLPQAILSKAFSGELVPTEAELARLEGREYESASMLLERVTEDAQTAATKAKRSPPRRQQRASA